jgi:hypothetical protein
VRDELKPYQVPRLITDANPYNAREDSGHLYHPSRHVESRDSLEIDRLRQGLHWVGDLMVEADVEIDSPEGELLLDLVEGGRHFTCTIDLTSGEAALSAEGAPSFAPKAKTSLDGPGSYRVAFANFDDQLLLWVDGGLISFEGGTGYDVEQVFGCSYGETFTTSPITGSRKRETGITSFPITMRPRMLKTCFTTRSGGAPSPRGGA